MVKLLTSYVLSLERGEWCGGRYALMYPQQDNHGISRTYKINSPAADYLCCEK